ncbi:uncharacterized protein LOC141857374 [Brevipalpus obovatus]|uniref:uncharacterized protein LOC141857374 n=1 Tax=Brevipalpus obovatus TaxID=246614 RepID=UPI003D9EFBCE
MLIKAALQFVRKPYFNRKLSHHVIQEKMFVNQQTFSHSNSDAIFQRSTNQLINLKKLETESWKNIPNFHKIMCEKYADRPCYGTRTRLSSYYEKKKDGQEIKKYVLDDHFTYTTYREAYQKVQNIAQSLYHLGVKRKQIVPIFAETRQEWMLTAHAIWRNNAIVATLFPNLPDDGIIKILNDTEATLLITSDGLLLKLQKLKKEGRLPFLKHIVHMKETSEDRSPITMDEFELTPFENLTSKKQTEPINFLSPESIDPHDEALIVHTSGTTGLPKGVIMTHFNCMSSLRGSLYTMLEDFPVSQEDVYLGFLPSAHIFGLACEILMFSKGIPVAYSSPLTMSPTSTGLIEGTESDLNLVKPTVMSAVPLVLERMKKAVQDRIQDRPIKLKILRKALEYKKRRFQLGSQTPIVDRFVLKQIKQGLGGRLRLILSGGASLLPETHEFTTLAFCCRVLQGYAATETTCGGIFMNFEDFSFGRVGAPMHDLRVKLVDWDEGGYSRDDLPNSRGELLLGGNMIASGYFKNPEDTKQLFVEIDGIRYWKSGDIGEVFPDGTFKIIDRRKDIVKLSNGRFIALGKIETILKACPVVDNICVYGDSIRDSIIAFIVPKREEFDKFCKSLNKGSEPFSSRCQNPEVIHKLHSQLSEEGFSAGLDKHEIPSKIWICQEEWTTQNDMLTPILKVCRPKLLGARMMNSFLRSVTEFVALLTTLKIADYLIVKPVKSYRKSKKRRAVKSIVQTRDESFNNITEAVFTRITPRLRVSKMSPVQNLSSFLKTASLKFADRPCYGTRNRLAKYYVKDKDGQQVKKYILDDHFEYTSYQEVYRKIQNIALSLSNLGVKIKQIVPIFAETRQEWMLTAHAIWRRDAIVATMFPNLSNDEIVHILNDTEANFLVTTDVLLPKLQMLKKEGQLPHLQHIVYMRETIEEKSPIIMEEFKLIPFEDILISESDHDDDNEWEKSDKHTEEALIMYTSGSTGLPKGAIITHSNLIHTILSVEKTIFGSEMKSGAYMSYLPLAHILGISCTSLMTSVGCRIAFSSPATLTTHSPDITELSSSDADLAQPLYAPCVPLVLERIKRTIEDKLRARPIISRIFYLALEYKKFWRRLHHDTPVVNYFIFDKTRKILGGKTEIILVGGAPLQDKTQEFIELTLCTRVIQGYGSTETCGGGLLMDLEDRTYGRCGAPFHDMTIKLVPWAKKGYSPDDIPNPRGEIWIGGSNIVAGYFKDPLKTENHFVTDENGMRFWKSGDIAEAFPDGTFRIIDRKRDIVKLSNGEFVPVGRVEAVLRSSSLIENICVTVKRGENYCVALVVPNREELIKLARSMEKDMDFEQLCEDTEMINEFILRLTQLGKAGGLRRFEIPQKVLIVNDQWTLDNGLVTPSMKLRRHQIKKKYAEHIDSMYPRYK